MNTLYLVRIVECDNCGAKYYLNDINTPKLPKLHRVCGTCFLPMETVNPLYEFPGVRMGTQELEGVKKMKTDTKRYLLIELRSGLYWMRRYDRIDALEKAHLLNKLYPKERWSICAV